MSYRDLMRDFRVRRMCTFVGALALASQAAQRPVALEQPPALLLLRVAPDPAGQRQEARFSDELSLALDSFAIFAVPPDDDSFLKLPLSEQVDSVSAMANQNAALAVVWVVPYEKKQLLVNVVAVETGRTLVRSMAVGNVKNPEAMLALAVRELLGTAYLFEPERAQKKEALRQIVGTVKEELSLTAKTQAPATPQPLPEAQSQRFGFRAAALTGQGPVGGPSVFLRWGGRLEAAWHLSPNWRLGVSTEGSSFSGPSDAQSYVNGWELAPGVNASYSWSVGRWLLGPCLELQAVWEHLTGWSEFSGSQAFASWKGRGLAGASVVRRLEGPWAVGVRAGVEFNQARTQVFRVDDQSLVASSPWVGWRAEICVAFQ